MRWYKEEQWALTEDEVLLVEVVEFEDCEVVPYRQVVLKYSFHKRIPMSC